MRHGRYELAKRSLHRLTRAKSNQGLNVDDTLAMMRYTNEAEKTLSGSGISYLDCFKGTDRRRTEIVCMAWITQSLCGGAFNGYAAYLFEQAGLSISNSFTIGIGMYIAGLVGGLLAWGLLRKFGRRTLYIWGLALSFAILMVAGGVGVMTGRNETSWALGSLIVFLTFIYDSTIGPVCYALVAEIPSSRLRVKSIVLARIAYNLSSLIVNTITSRMLNPTAWNWGGKSCFLYAGTTMCCLTWTYFRLPEPKGLTYLELDILFSKKANARKFRRFQTHLERSGYFDLAQATGRETT